MKDLMAICAVLLLLMTFPLQYALNTKNHFTISIMQKYVNNAKEEARQIGYFSTPIIDELKDNIADDCHMDKDDIDVVATSSTDIKYRGDLIHYKVSMPIHKILASSEFWGVEDKDNNGVYVIESYAASELVKP